LQRALLRRLEGPWIPCRKCSAFATIKSWSALTILQAFFNVDTLDWQGDYVAAKKNYINALSGGKPASSSFIVLAHDIHQQTVADLVPYMIAQLKALGYSTATMGECLNDPPENWYRDPASGQPIGKSKPLPTRSSSAPVLKATATASKPTPSAAANGTTTAASTSASGKSPASVSTSTLTSTSAWTSTTDFFNARSSGTPVAAVPPAPDTSQDSGSRKSKKSSATTVEAYPIVAVLVGGLACMFAF
jgi:hypothetical protein